MVSLNKLALESLAPALENPDRYQVAAARTSAGSTLIDFGLNTRPGYPAAMLFARVCMAGLAELNVTNQEYGPLFLPSINVAVEAPSLSLMASQYAGWAINKDGYFAMASGPARALKGDEEIFGQIDHKEKSDTAVVCLEASSPPPAEVIDYILEKTGVEPDRLYILFAPTSSLTGSVQVSARIVETAAHKMHTLGFSLEKIAAGCGSAPIAPISPDQLQAIGRTNDCVLYGGSAHITVDCADDEAREVADKIPSSTSKDYGRTFLELYREYGDFYGIDPLLFSPARVTVANRRTGAFFTAGNIDPAMLAKSFGQAS